MAMDPEALYRELGQLLAETPGDLAGPGPISADTHRWLGRTAALLAETVEKLDTITMFDQIAFTSASDGLEGILQKQNAHQIVTILHRALARAERNAPAAAQGAFIPVGAAFDVFQVIGKVLSVATNDALIVDAYMGPKVLTDFAPLAPERVAPYACSQTASTPNRKRCSQQWRAGRNNMALHAPSRHD